MKAIRIEAHGGPQLMKLREVGAPMPGSHEVRVRHEVIGVNFVDTYYRSGLYRSELPSGLGFEAAGFVDAVGPDVVRYRVGDRVAYCSGTIGAYADTHVVPEGRLVRLPDTVGFEVAAASLLKGLTAQYLLRKTFAVKRNDTVVIQAAAGGVGQIATQWAKHLGAVVIAVVGNDAKAEIANAIGADHVIVRSREHIVQRVREITDGVGAHVVYDGVGKDTFGASLDCLRPLGMMVSFGNASGAVPELNLLQLSEKGSLFVTRPRLAHYIATVEQLDEAAAELFAVIADGVVKVARPTRYALADAAQAHRDLESRTTTGSLVLTP